MKPIVRRKLAAKQRRIKNKLNKKRRGEHAKPMFTASNIHYEVGGKAKAIDCGGIGVVCRLVKTLGLAVSINFRVQVLKIHQPYHESDHVLGIAYNLITGGHCLDDIERRRNDEVYLDAVGAEVVPDPTTAGDFCRRFDVENILALQEAYDEARLKVWQRQPEEFFERAILDADGTLVPTNGQCKEGMEYSYKGVWGYHPLLVSLANTAEPLRIINRPGNVPSHEKAFCVLDDCIDLCRSAGFRTIALRGDTDFSQTAYLDGWHEQSDVRFYFGFDAHAKLNGLAIGLPETAWKPLKRREKHTPAAPPRTKPHNLKEDLVREHEFETLRLQSEEVAEFEYQPGNCERAYRMIVLRKNISREKGEVRLIDEMVYFFYITNDRERTAEQVVFFCNDRCNQENLIEQLKNGVRALKAPSNTLESNWAYMTMAMLAWCLKAWMALLLPEPAKPKADKSGKQRRSAKAAEKRTLLRMEFRQFVDYLIRIPAQIVRGARRITYRLLNYNPWQVTLFRILDVPGG